MDLLVYSMAGGGISSIDRPILVGVCMGTAAIGAISAIVRRHFINPKISPDPSFPKRGNPPFGKGG
ncbi:MAG: hypothetical protein ABII26_04000 [Pseudomonadota bacterium]